MNVLALFKSITTFVLDVDGVLTDGTLQLLPGGEMSRRMNIKDGYALQLAVKKGYRVVIISGGKSESVVSRLQGLGIKDIYTGIHDKQEKLQDYVFENDLRWDEILYMGADIVIHSASKYLSGHCDVIAGLVVANSKVLADQIRYNQNISGSILSPFEAWLTIRGIETLYLRLEKQCSNATAIANWLAVHPAIDKVFYPGLATHKNHHIARKQQKNYGGLVSFSLKSDNIKNAIRIVNATKLFKLAESFGGVKSMLAHPATMTHRNIPEEFRKKTGLQDSCIRLSVGIEDADDLINDLKQALDKLNHPAGKQITVLQ
jgi:YrbI family 3-deoxy-D-manno-octulosonate 8-phosphate phosphatase